ncbi:MAG: FAD-binding protein, partial [Acidobacteria bacterium]
VLNEASAIVGDQFAKRDVASLDSYGTDAVNKTHRPDLVLLPGSRDEISGLARLCHTYRVPMVVRGAGTGYSGGAVPIRGGIVLSLERLNRILEIDQDNLLARVQPNVITADLHAAVERVGLMFPPDPASLHRSTIGGNIAECAGGPRAFKYGTTKRYVLGLEVVLPTGEVIHTGSKAVKNVVGYDLTQLLVGSEGTLGIITEATLRLVPKPPARATLRATFDGIEAAAGAVTALIRARVVPAAIELIDADCLTAVAEYLGATLAPAGTGALLLIEVDGFAAGVAEELARVEEACRAAGAGETLRATTDDERDTLWRVRRELSPALKVISPIKFNHDVVVPRGRVPQLFDLVSRLKHDYRLRIPCFGHAGDGNIHVNIMVDPADVGGVSRAHEAERALFEGVVALEGSISGEHGIGFTKAPFIGLELSPGEIGLMKRLKLAFDPHNVLNPGKIFPA